MSRRFVAGFDRARDAPHDGAQPTLRGEDRCDLRAHTDHHKRGVIGFETNRDLDAIAASQLQNRRIRLHPIAACYRNGRDVTIEWCRCDFGLLVVAELTLSIDSRRRIVHRFLGGGELCVGCQV